jgi:Flp pilus assembly protein TadD
MKRATLLSTMSAGLVAVVALSAWQVSRRKPAAPSRGATLATAPAAAPAGSPGTLASISIDYPSSGSVFPPEFPAPTWQWRDPADAVDHWGIEVQFSDGAPALRSESTGPRLRVGDLDPRCVSTTNKPPELTPEQAAAHTWVPDDAAWKAIKQHSTEQPARIVVTGYRKGPGTTVVSRGEMSITTSKDPVAAPIFYRDVPLMPSETEKGTIKPLAPKAVPLIAWRLRNIAERESHVMMEGLHTCANCHSFSADGKTLGLDMDGPQNDKGLYAIVKVQPHMSIRSQDMVAWSTFRGKLGSKLRVGFMSRISPDGEHVVTTVNDPGIDQSDYQRRKNPIDLIRNYYVANFKDYRFLQVFFPTRGVLAWYSRKAEHLRYLPGADDPRYVQTNAVWSPDGKYLVFARAPAQDAYPAGSKLATHANDPNERQVRYDLYRIPFNGGKGGKAEPIAGASDNGMSNSFPKVSPDGRFIVFVQARNGLLMRPDGQLYIVPAKGGTARRMRCNTKLMNSWHSFSPNGRWLVFSSKSRSPYTQMFLTHIDEDGNDTPAILIENSTAANRAVNLPEFVNIPPDGMQKIDTPAAEYALHVDLATDAMKSKDYPVAVAEWNKALELVPEEARVHNSLAVALMETGKVDEALVHYRKALALNPGYAEACNNLGEALAGKGDSKDAVAQFEKAVELDPDYLAAHANLGLLLARTGHPDKAVKHLKKVAEGTPEAADARMNLGHALAEKGDFAAARVELETAVKLSGRSNPLPLYFLGRVYGDLGKQPEAIQTERQALALAVQQNNARLAEAISAHLGQLQGRRSAE